MQVLVKSRNEGAELHCRHCGQGFVLYWAHHAEAEKAAMLEEVKAVLAHHHATIEGITAHPHRGFLVPAWNGPIAYSGAAILGNAPGSAL